MSCEIIPIAFENIHDSAGLGFRIKQKGVKQDRIIVTAVMHRSLLTKRKIRAIFKERADHILMYGGPEIDSRRINAATHSACRILRIKG